MTAQPAPAGAAQPNGDPTVMHVWLPAGHTLCELEEGDFLEDHLREMRTPDAAVCGPCLMLVSRIRRQACALLELAGGTVAPTRPSEAWRLVDKGGWSSRLDLKDFLRNPAEVDAGSRFDAVWYAMDRDSVLDTVLEMAAARDRR